MRLALSMVEVILSVLLVGGLLVAALNTVGAATVGQQKTTDREVGHLLAQDLMTEILQQHYEDPEAPISLGPEALEIAGNRAAYDDVDDYHGWDASPPQRKGGTLLSGRTNWRRTVTVDYVATDDLTVVVASDLGIKRITVTVEHNGVVVASLVAIRADVDEF